MINFLPRNVNKFGVGKIMSKVAGMPSKRSMYVKLKIVKDWEYVVWDDIWVDYVKTCGNETWILNQGFPSPSPLPLRNKILVVEWIKVI